MLSGPLWLDPDTGVESRCWPFTGVLNNEGRPYISINGKKELCYRVVWRLVNGEDLGKLLYRHRCDNPVCCNPSHGVPGDHQENMDDMKDRERHGLSHHMVRAIRKMTKGDLTYQQIADIVGTSKTTVSDIANKVNYSHVKDEEDAS
jgi:hypothetical protein